MKRVPVEPEDQEGVWQERVRELEGADVGVLRVGHLIR
jgi:hypothetical protein